MSKAREIAEERLAKGEMVNRYYSGKMATTTRCLFFLLAFLCVLTNGYGADTDSMVQEGRNAYKAKEYDRARALFDQACTGGNAEGCSSLGVMFNNGIGGAQDKEQARTLFDQACIDGSAKGCSNLGVVFNNGDGVAQDNVRALALHKQACTGGFVKGCDMADAMFDNGTGGAVKDKFIGDASAPVTIIEYSSLACPHCQIFHSNIYPVLKEKYIDTGKVKLVLRLYLMRSFDRRETTAARREITTTMLSNCAQENKYYSIVSDFLSTTNSWMKEENWMQEIYRVSKKAGLSEMSVDTCLSNLELSDNLRISTQKAFKDYGVHGVPAFLVNGKLLVKDEDTGIWLKDGILMKGKPPAGSNGTILVAPDSSLRSIVEAVEAEL